MKSILFFFFLLITFLLSPTWVSASLVVVDKNGGVNWNVLSDSDALALRVSEKRELSVHEVAGGKEGNNIVLLKKEDGKIKLRVGDRESLDVTNWDKDVVEIEERGDAKKVQISVSDGNFVISQQNVAAKTSFPISIDPSKNEFSLLTDNGTVFLSVLPLEAAETSLRSKYLSKVTDNNLEIDEGDLGVLAYTVRGEKVINLFNLVNMSIPVSTHVSTTSGEILSVDQPKWLSILGFLFS